MSHAVLALAATLTTNHVFTARSSVAMTKRVAAADFARTPDSHVLVRPGDVTRIGSPRIVGTGSARLRFLGPFLLLPRVHVTPKTLPTDILSADITLARLTDAALVHDQVVICQDRSGNDDSGAYFIATDSFRSPWELALHPHLHVEDKTKYRLRRPVEEVQRLRGHYLMLDSFNRKHYGHFLVDVLTMAWAYDHARSLGIDDLKVIVTSASPRAPFIRKMLGKLGIPERAICWFDHAVMCEDLLIATKSFLTQSYHTPLAAVTWQTIRDGFDTGRGEPDLYVSRSLVGGRKLINEAEVEAEFMARGFAVVHPERLPIATQVNLWANARRIAGPGGSGVFNVVFKRKLEKAFFLHSPNMVRLSEMLLQGGDPVETTYYVGASEQRDVHAPWSVDMEDLRARLDEWLG